MSKTKSQYSTALSYPHISWPLCSPEIEAASLTLLQPILKTIGEHRKNNTTVSRGKNRPKRKLHTEEVVEEPETGLLQSTIIGLQSNWRRLEEQARDPQGQEGGKLTILFCCRDALPEPAVDALLRLVAVASRAKDATNAIRLLSIAEKSEQEIASTLGLRRAAIVGICEANPRAGPLVRYLRENMPPLQAPWLDESPLPTYLPVKVKTTLIPVKDKQDTARKKAKPS